MASNERIEALKRTFVEQRDTYQRETGKREQILEQKKTLLNELEERQEEERLLRIEREILDRSSERGKQESAKIAERLVTRTLKYVFDDDIDFRINLSAPGGQPNMDFETEVTRSGKRIAREPVEGGGLGIVDVLSMALRILGLNVIDKGNEAPMVFDEPGKSVSAQFQERMAEYLKQTSISFGRQIFLITHNRDTLGMIGDKSFLVEMDSDQVSRVSEL